MAIANVGLQVTKADGAFSERPTLYWEVNYRHFAIIKLGLRQNQNQCLYRGKEKSAQPGNF